MSEKNLIVTKACARCGTTGRIDGRACPTCRGHGKLKQCIYCTGSGRVARMQGAVRPKHVLHYTIGCDDCNCEGWVHMDKATRMPTLFTPAPVRDDAPWRSVYR